MLTLFPLHPPLDDVAHSPDGTPTLEMLDVHDAVFWRHRDPHPPVRQSWDADFDSLRTLVAPLRRCAAIGLMIDVEAGDSCYSETFDCAAR
jgi:hypothetical protein